MILRALVIFSLFLSLNSIFSQTPPVETEKFKPILPFSLSSNGFPMLENILRNEKLNKGVASGTKYRNYLVRQFKIYRKKISVNPNSINLLFIYYGLLTKYSYHLLNNIQNIKKSDPNTIKFRKRLKRLRIKIRSVGFKIIKKTNDPEEKIELLVDLALIRYLKEKHRKESITILEKVKLDNLSDSSRLRVKLALSLYYINSKDRDKQKKSLKNIEFLKLSKTRRLSLLSHLVLARYKVGLNKEGKKTRKTDLSYRKNLGLVSYLCRNLNLKERAEIFKLISGIWIKADDFKKDWSHQPYSPHCFKELASFWAIKERNTLSELKSKKWKSAKDKYLNISKVEVLKKYRKSIDLRLAKLFKLNHNVDSYYEDYQNFLLTLLARYNTNKLKRSLSKKHFDLVQYEIERFKSDKNIKSIDKIKKMITKFLHNSTNRKRKRKIKFSLAEIFEKVNLYEDGVNILNYLVKDEKDKSLKIKFIMKKIELLHKMAKLPMSLIWEKKYFTNNNNVQELIKNYYDLSYLQNVFEWKLSKNLALLEFYSQRWRKALSLWKNAIIENPSHDDSPKAVKFIIAFMKKQKLWDVLEEFAFFAIKLDINYQSPQESQDIKNSLELALYEGALLNMMATEYSEAKRKILLLVNGFKKSSNYSRFLFLLSECYLSLQEYRESTQTNETLLSLGVENDYYLTSAYMSEYIHMGQAEEEQSLLNLNVLLDSKNYFPYLSDVRVKKAKILLSSSNYEEAEEQLNSVKIEDISSDKFNKYFEFRELIAEKKENITSKNKALFQLLNDSQTPIRIVKRVSVRLLENYFKVNNSQKIDEVLTSLIKNEKYEDIIDELKHYIEFLKSEKLLSKSLNNIETVIVSKIDMLGERISKDIEIISKHKRLFCNYKTNKYCGRFNESFLKYSRQLLAMINDLSSPSGKGKLYGLLDKEINNIKDKIKKNIDDCHENKMELMTKNHLHPKIVSQYLWEIKRDWNFNKGIDSGINFVQLETNKITN